jgi:hypothetical protein
MSRRRRRLAGSQVLGLLVRSRVELDVDLLRKKFGARLITITLGFDPELDAEVVEADADSWGAKPRRSEDLRGVPAANGEMASVIATGQIVRVVFRHHEPEQGWPVEMLGSRAEALVVEIAYTDVSGRQPTASRLYLAPLQNDPDRHYTVAKVRPLVNRKLIADVTWAPPPS